MIALSSLLSRCAISGGIPAGPNIAAKNSTLIGGMPASTVVGTCGSSGQRCGSVTASAFRRPLWMWEKLLVGVAKTAWIVPPRMSVTDGASPL